VEKSSESSSTFLIFFPTTDIILNFCFLFFEGTATHVNIRSPSTEVNAALRSQKVFIVSYVKGRDRVMNIWISKMALLSSSKDQLTVANVLFFEVLFVEQIQKRVKSRQR